jgi:uncharacterized protein (DUF952 family)
MTHPDIIFRLTSESEWEQALQKGTLAYAPIDAQGNESGVGSEPMFDSVA